MLRIALTAVLALAAVPFAQAAGPYDDLLKHTTPYTNSLVLIDVKGAFSSPLAKAEKWAEQARTNSHGGLGFVPSDAEVIVIAGQVSVLSPRDVYFTTFSGQEFVAIYPADRQYTARYLKAALAAKAPPLAAYLKKAAEKADGNTLTIAVDLEDVADRAILKMSLPSSPAVAKIKNLDVALLATTLASVKGMTVAVKVNDAIAASVTLEFGRDPTLFRMMLPDLVRELVESQGVAIAGFESWEAKYTATTMTLSGKLSSADFKRIVSLFAFPQPQDESEPMVKANAPSVPLTKRYLAAVDAVLGDIKSMKDSPKYEKTATWHEKAAAQIEQLSKQGVDPVAVDAAFQAAKRLRAIAASLRGVPIDMDALASQQYYSSRPSIGVIPHGWWGVQPFIFGPGQVETNLPQIQEKMSQVIANDKKTRLEAWSQIERTMIDSRRKLSEKYKTDF
jgi:hypothetical protein